ncbi:MAG: flagellar basal body P-ring formation chaperone FlgA [Helicobacter sp.]|nr:flagellar basal body P-ring formation chaperone FlgA [Helicobacter sp.]
MIKKILWGIILTFQGVFGLDYLILEEEYFFKERNIYARDIFKEIQEDFLLLEIPKNSNHFQVRSTQFIDKFANFGIHVGAKSPIITFKKSVGGDTQKIKTHITELFLQEYRKNNIKIHRIVLEQITPLDFTDIKSIDFPTNLLKRKEGTLSILTKEKREEDRSKKIFFKYYLEATLEGIRLIKPINGGGIIDHQNAKVVEIAFDRITSPLMKKEQLGQVAVRSYTPRDVLVTEDRLTKKRVVKKGDKIVVGIQEEGVTLEFILEAQKDAGIGDVIKARAVEGKKIYQVEILGMGRGKLL